MGFRKLASRYERLNVAFKGLLDTHVSCYVEKV